MATVKKRVNIFESEEGAEIQAILNSMTKDSVYSTESSYSANGVKYPDHRMSFVDKHMNYLNTHPSVDPKHYIANLRLATRIRV